MYKLIFCAAWCSSLCFENEKQLSNSSLLSTQIFLFEFTDSFFKMWYFSSWSLKKESPLSSNSPRKKSMSKVIVVVPKKITRKKTKNKKNPFYSFLPFRCDLYYIIVNAHEKKTNVIKNWWCWKWWYYSLSFLVHNNNVLSSRPNRSCDIFATLLHQFFGASSKCVFRNDGIYS